MNDIPLTPDRRHRLIVLYIARIKEDVGRIKMLTIRETLTVDETQMLHAALLDIQAMHEEGMRAMREYGNV